MLCDMELVKIRRGPDVHPLSYHDWYSSSFLVTIVTDILNSTVYHRLDPSEHWPCMVQHQHCAHLPVHRRGVHLDLYRSRDEPSTRHAKQDEASPGGIL